MNDAHMQALLNALQQQRNAALNALAQCEANLMLAQTKIRELEQPPKEPA